MFWFGAMFGGTFGFLFATLLISCKNGDQINKEDKDKE